MEKIIEYFIIVDGSPSQVFSEKVNRFLKDGWFLYGYPYVIGNSHYQPMVKYKEFDKKEVLND